MECWSDHDYVGHLSAVNKHFPPVSPRPLSRASSTESLDLELRLGSNDSTVPNADDHLNGDHDTGLGDSQPLKEDSGEEYEPDVPADTQEHDASDISGE